MNGQLTEMNLDLIREGGIGAYAAIAFGGVGAMLGAFALVALLGKSRSAFGLGIAVLTVSALTSGVGMLGTVYGRYQVTRAVAFVGSGIDTERLLRAGHREAQSSSWVGFFAALLPLALGALAAVVGSRLQRPRTRTQGFAEPVVSTDDGLSSQTVMAFIFVGISAVPSGGAWAMAHSELPKTRYSYDEMDSDGWALAAALDDVKNEKPHACDQLAVALDRYRETESKLDAWPRKMKPIHAELSGWRAAADACAQRIATSLDDDSLSLPWTQAGLLRSSLLQDDALHARVLSWTPKTPDSLPEEVGNGTISTQDIQVTIRADLKAIRTCYERELAKSPGLGGRLEVQFTIGLDGRVSAVEDVSDEAFPSQKVTDCVMARFTKLDFPRPRGGAVNVKYPFVFKAH